MKRLAGTDLVSKRRRSVARVAVTAALAVAFSFQMVGCSEGNLSDTAYLERAKASQDKGDLRASLIDLKNALRQNPDNAEARYLLGAVHNKNGNFAAAEKELRRAKQAGFGAEKVQAELGRALFGQGKFAELLEELKPADDTTGEGAAGVLTARGNAQLALGRKEEAKASFESALRAVPGFAEASLGRARLALVERDFAEALRQVEDALSAAPRLVEAWLAKGDLLRLKARNDDAAAAYKQALAIDANNVAAHLSLASLHIAGGDLQAAHADVAAARKIAPKNPMARYMEALVNFRQGKYPEARDAVLEVLKTAPDHMPTVLLSGAVAYALANYELAEQELSRFLAQYPDNAYARNTLAATHLKKGDAARALETLKPALGAESQDIQALTLAGEASIQAKEFTKASTYFERAAAIDDDNITLRTKMAISRLSAGETDRAISELEAAAAADPSQHKADTVLVLTHLRNKHWDKALTAISVLERKLPNNPAVHNFRGAAYLGKQDFSKARASFEQALAIEPAHITAAANLAQLDLQDKNPQVARKRFEAVLAKDKKNVRAMLALAKLAATANQEQEYYGWLEKAANADSAALEPRRLLVAYFLQKKEVQKALDIARDAQAANPTKPEALDLLGTTQFAAGEKENALATYTKLVELAPKSALAHYQLATVQVATQAAETARATLTKALELRPGYLEAATVLATLEIRGGRYAEALKIAKKLQAQNPKVPGGHVLEGDVLMAHEQFAPAAQAYEKALAVEKNGLTVIKQHQALKAAGREKEADAKLLQWVKERPNDFGARAYLAEAYMRGGKNPQATEQFEYIRQKDPGNIGTLNNLAVLYQATRDPRALPTAEQAYKASPRSAAVQDTLGWILLGEGQTSRALTLLEKAVAGAPEQPEIAYHYAAALVKSGDKLKARAQLEKALASGKAFSQKADAAALLQQLPPSR